MLCRRDNRIQARSPKNCPIFALGSSFGEPQGFNSVVSAIDRAARTQLLPSLKVSLDQDVSLSM